MKTITKYVCEKCGEYQDKIIPIKEQKTLSNMTTTKSGLKFDFRHKDCGGHVVITDNGIARKEIVNYI